MAVAPSCRSFWRFYINLRDFLVVLSFCRPPEIRDFPFMASNSRKRADHSVLYRRTQPSVSRHKRSSKHIIEPAAKIVTTPEFIRSTLGFWKAVSLPVSSLNFHVREGSFGTFHGGLSVGYHFSSSAKSDNEHLNAVNGIVLLHSPPNSLKITLENHADIEKLTLETRTSTICDSATEVSSIEEDNLPLGDLKRNDAVATCGNLSQCCSSANGDLENISLRSSSAMFSSEIPSLSDSSLSSDYKEDKLLPEERKLLKKFAQEKEKTVFHNPNSDKKLPPTVPTSMLNKIEGIFSNGKHALAGGLAGIFVSICMHPIDTVKSIVQARGTSQESLPRTIKRIISERGVMGLYRGIPSNLASSAPISAVYTFTYESAKGTFLPLLPKEYHSLAHCGAGGCASVATSFIFTPSERVKQQMQVHSCYQNSWTALMGIVQKGGFPSLYVGWRAVLWRNVPHSIIKFYTYERLKPLMHPVLNQDACFSALPTLVCGGIAGSTAALFTTPFDVVKTRFQAQMPGSHGKQSVLSLMKDISKREGFRGLYRGLTPRLLMYVSQGAIFFGSYEFLKSLFSLKRGDHAGGESCHVSTVSNHGLPKGALT